MLRLDRSPYIFARPVYGAVCGAACGAAQLNEEYVCQEERVRDYEPAYDEDDSDDAEVEQSYSGRFSLRLPRYLHRHLSEVAREQGVSLNQFVCTAAVRAAEAASAKPVPQGTDRVSEEEYQRIWRNTFG
jgi:predicted HicB family RNase H-like nuclease